ncbi:SDR family NAD(P)-dependent oxidoreductase [Burkholderia gladioli]|uniref:SDR family NAD(P)-dependent oxidoreductase n=1 Tax=Burkholderia gladioli TaxID=28095 RepID=UPI00163E2602|nr:SDR family NAD(P)-dependent oxidoreductase [Burkholderia gladioli]
MERLTTVAKTLLERRKLPANRELTRLQLHLLWHRLGTLGFGLTPTGWQVGEALLPGYTRWLDESARLLREAGFPACAGQDAQTLRARWRELEASRAFEQAGVASQARLVAATLEALPDVLTGRRPITDVLFPDSSMAQVEAIYKHNAQADYFNDLAAWCVRRVIDARRDEGVDAPLRILEIGAGTGGTSERIFDALAPVRERIAVYTYTDVSRAFLQHAQDSYVAAHPYVDCRLFDVERPLAAQQMASGSYDIVLAANVLHATRNIRRTLDNAKALLKRNGVLIVNEIVERSLFAHLSFGLTDGWWLVEDGESRLEGCPALSTAQWDARLGEAGFDRVRWPVPLAGELGQQVFMARSDGRIRQPEAVTPPSSPSSSVSAWPAPDLPAGREHAARVAQAPVAHAGNDDDPALVDAVRAAIARHLTETLRVPAEQIAYTAPFGDYGVDSITGVKLVHRLNDALGATLETTHLYDYSTIRQLADHLVRTSAAALRARLLPAPAGRAAVMADVPAPRAAHAAPMPAGCGEQGDGGNDRMASPSREPAAAARAERPPRDPIAVVGMSGRFARAADLDALWAHLANGDDLVGPVTRWPKPAGRASGDAAWFGGLLDDIDRFDARFFNISATEASVMDPQQRLFLEEAWQALEAAGYAGEALDAARCGVYVGYNGADYQTLVDEHAPAQAMWGNAGSILSARIAYCLNLQGPAVTIDTACSSSLVSVHLACQALRAREIDAALAGGAFVQATPGFYLLAGRAGMLSPTGRCATFAAGADGFVPAEGVGVVMLKRLADALDDGDTIHGVIRGSGINQDGTTSGITAPSALSQERLQREVYDSWGIDVETIGLVEAHGTGTRLGDPVEHRALASAFRRDTAKRGFCALGAIKTNLGHAAAAAGIAGLLKLLLALRHRQIPPSLHFDAPNPAIDFADSPFYVNTTLQAWNPPPGMPRRAALSAFGFSGTNAHLVIDGHEGAVPAAPARPARLLVLSARTPEQLRELALRLARHLRAQPALDLGNVCHTLCVGRRHLAHRLACTPATLDELAATLESWLAGEAPPRLFTGHCSDGARHERAVLRHYATDCIARLAPAAPALDAADFVAQLAVLAELYVEGYALDYARLFEYARHGRVPLPTYPFSDERYWIRASAPAAVPDSRPRDAGAARAAAEVWLARPAWRAEPATPAATAGGFAGDRHVWVLAGLDDASLAAIDGERLCTAGPDDAASYVEAAAALLERVRGVLEHGVARPVLVQLLIGAGEGAGFGGLAALLKTAVHENPKLLAQTIEIAGRPDGETLRAWLDADAADAAGAGEIRRAGALREVRRLERVAAPALAPEPVWRDGAVHLITGGLGGLGHAFANAIARASRRATLVLVNRSAPDATARARVAALEALGARVVVCRADVADADAVRELVRRVVHEHGALASVIHAAGVLRDSLILKKTGEELREVMAPKVAGLVNLDAATRELRLDRFVCFSALAGVYGNPGQADYAAANAFADRFAAWREARVREGERHGRTLAIAWPLWADGGMQMNDLVKERMLRSGLGELGTAEGLAAFEAGLAGDAAELVVLCGTASRLDAFVGVPRAAAEAAPAPARSRPAARHDAPEGLRAGVLARLAGMLAEVTNLDAARIDGNEPFEHFGIDSIMIGKLNHALDEVFDALPRTLFYEYRNLGALAEHLVREDAPACAAWLEAGGEPAGRGAHEAAERAGRAAASLSGVAAVPALASAPGADTAVEDTTRAEASLPAALAPERGGQAEAGAPAAVSNPAGPRAQDTLLSGYQIAIIGLSGRYPRARTLDDYWDNLRTGRDCITEIPPERWSLEGFYDPQADCSPGNGKSYCKWGGFLEGFAEFDPLFFGISPREAESMDPQERLFVETCWEVIEDAGYTRRTLRERHDGRIGVYAGITKTGFDLYGPALWARGDDTYPHTSFCSLANRVSYLFDFNGPSLAFDTMCSSSLVAIHEACAHLLAGECELAIAGGVNLYLHPSNYVALCAHRMLSPDGRCRSFGAGANGYVPGEAVGAVLLKPLAAAQADGDNIHGIVRGSAINHGGKTHGYTVPNPGAQGALIERALARAGVAARQLGYVEAHGTGTELGDPIEIAGLMRAFGADAMPAEDRPCALGSVKSNIGHAESAAGIAAVTKVLLQFRHRQLVPTLHVDTPSPQIRFERTPLRLQTQLADWDAPGGTPSLPRLAGVSSFGAAGTNAHVVLQEYPAPDASPAADGEPVLIVLSARDERALRDSAARLGAALARRGHHDRDLPDIAWTLQIGREPMDERLALVVRDVAALREALDAFAADGRCLDGVLRGSAVERPDALGTAEALAEVAAQWLAQRRYRELAKLWVAGFEPDWRALTPAGRPARRVSLPTYPFARECYGLPVVAVATASSDAPAPASARPVDGPLEYEPAWLPAASAEAALDTTGIAALLHVSEDPAVTADVSAALRAAGETVAVIPVTREASARPAQAQTIVLDGTDETAWRAVFAGLRERLPRDAAIGIVHAHRSGAARLAELHALLRAARAEAVALRRLVVLGSWDEAQAQGCGDQAAIGLVRSLRLSMPQLRASVLFGEGGLPDAESVVRSWRETSGADVLRERAGRRETLGWRAVEPAPAAADLRERGVYLITGGAGGLGRLFARHLARRCHARLALVGRRVRDGEIDALLDELRAHGATDAAYFPAEVADEDALRGVVETIRMRWGGLHGVLHAAGVATRGTLEDRRPEDVEAVISPKVAGTQALDAATADEALDFFCCFSSSSAVLGDSGAGDYAGANAYQLAYAAYRNARVEAGERSGRTVSVAWPLWREGGMGTQEGEAIEQYLRSSAQRYLEREEGLAAWERALASGAAQRLVLAGDRARVEGFLARLGATRQETGVEAPPSLPRAASGEADTWLPVLVRAGIEAVLKVPGERVRDTTPFADIGFDSIGLAQLAKWLSRQLGVEVIPSVFFSYSTVATLAAHLLASHGEALIASSAALPAASPARATPPGAPATPAPAVQAESVPITPAAPVAQARQATPAQQPSEPAGRAGAVLPPPIAIIGVSVRTAGANDAGELWELLRAGRQAIGEVPASRWDWRPYFSGPGEASNRIATNRGAFIEGLDGFDPLFFEISPREAQWMDPRQRLILEEAWRAFEDAGYAGERLRGSRCGVFIGVEEGVPGEAADGLATSHHNGILAARISYVLDLKGPNLAINTACSSGLVAVHAACQSVQRDECELALAGGVNVLNSPLTYVALTQGGMLSPDGECYTFDARANGMVPGEAAAAVVLKDLARAQADGDPIHGVIRASGVNYDGRTNGITAPSGLSQQQLVEQLYRRYRIDASEIGYVIAHGTGTRLGDPVEVNSLADAFRAFTDRRGFCALGSFKPNLGHTFAASGVVSLVAMLAAIRHRQIPPSANHRSDNEFLDLPNSAFRLVEHCTRWESDAPRVGAISAFGMSGTNAHLVIAEYVDARVPDAGQAWPAAACLVPLSARRPEQLVDAVRRLLRHLADLRRDAEESGVAPPSLASIAWTLQTGREAMKHRLIFRAGGLDELSARLGAWLGAGPGRALDDRDTDPLAARWAAGEALDWRAEYPHDVPRRTPLPAYPFTRRAAAGEIRSRDPSARLHPLVHEKLSA